MTLSIRERSLTATASIEPITGEFALPSLSLTSSAVGQSDPNRSNGGPMPTTEIEDRVWRAKALADVIEGWDPVKRAVHCSNCRHAIVSGEPENPTASCEAGHGKKAPLWPLIRAKNPHGFAFAAKCPDFSSMDDSTA